MNKQNIQYYVRMIANKQTKFNFKQQDHYLKKKRKKICAEVQHVKHESRTEAQLTDACGWFLNHDSPQKHSLKPLIYYLMAFDLTPGVNS